VEQLATDLVLVAPEAGVDRIEWAKQLVGNAVRSPYTRQAYLYALEQFFVWAAGRAISRESVQGYVTWLGEMKFSPSTINQRLAAIRKLATEAQRCGYVDSETAQAIVTVAGVSAKGRRLGRWLAWEEARTLLQAPNPHSIRGMRDRALLAVLVTCALRRGELSRMNCEHLAMRDGRWVFLDFLGKGKKVRSVAVPLWVKQAIDGWLDTAGIEKRTDLPPSVGERPRGRGRADGTSGVAARSRVCATDRDRGAGAARSAADGGEAMPIEGRGVGTNSVSART
jgi:site-specific recombinase XerD